MDLRLSASLVRGARRALDVARNELSADRVLERTMAGLIEIAAVRHPLEERPAWTPGSPFELLLVGYSGMRNTGADVRVEEIVRQLRHLFGDEHVALSVLTMNPEKTRGYFAGATQRTMPKVFPKFLFDTVHRHHGVVACEGSMFKSQFANALTVLMGGALGLASAEGKIAVGYGGEAGAMTPSLEEFVRRYCRDAYVIVRNAESQRALSSLGIRSQAGTDTAWTFRAGDPAHAEATLRQSGWDGRKPVLAVAPIEPFVWPIRPDLVKSAIHAATGVYGASHYDSIYFHRTSADSERKQQHYLASIANAVAAFRRERDVFPVVVGMEQLDRRACEDLAALLGRETPVFVSDEHDMYALVAILRRCAMVVSSRFHAIVTSMRPSIGITMDERIRNVLSERGDADLVLTVHDADLQNKLYAALLALDDNAEAVSDRVGRSVVANVARLGEMGRSLVDHVRAAHPELPIRSDVGGTADPFRHLPPLSSELRALAERYG